MAQASTHMTTFRRDASKPIQLSRIERGPCNSASYAEG